MQKAEEQVARRDEQLVLKCGQMDAIVKLNANGNKDAAGAADFLADRVYSMEIKLQANPASSLDP